MSHHDDSKKNYIFGTSAVTEDGQIAEMIYQPAHKKTEFLIKNKEGEIISQQGVELAENQFLLGFKPDNPMLKLRFIRLPSELGEFNNLQNLFEEVLEYINQYVSLPVGFQPVVATYIIMSWVYDKFPVIPYLRVIGGFGVGKTRFLEVVGNLSYTPMFVGGSASVSAVFRTLNDIRGTLVFDEADFRNSDLWSEVVKILNAGHDPNFPVLRMGKNDANSAEFVTKVFNVFGPKILASRNRFSDEALESRCVSQRLYPVKKLAVPVHLPERFHEDGLRLRNKLLAFRFSYYDKIVANENLLSGLNIPRVKQTVLALISVASMIGENVVNQITEFALKTESELRGMQVASLEVDVLICLLDIYGPKNEIPLPKKVYLMEIAKAFQIKYYKEFNDKQDKEVHAKDGVYVIPNYVVSAKRIGHIIRSLGIRTDRDNQGFYIPATEIHKIISLAEYHGITKDMLGSISSDEVV